MSLLVSNIQRFSLHDGPGIRTTVFLVGCGLRCPWCANPENMFKHENISELTGGEITYQEVTTDELYHAVMKDKSYYGDKGGITFSGGEPLFYAEELEKLLKKLKNENINCCIETSLFSSAKKLETVIPYFDEWIVDLKCNDKNKFRLILGGDISVFESNLRMLLAQIEKEKLTIRIPLIRDFNTDEEQLNLIKDVCSDIMPGKVQFLHAHGLAKRKYELLGMNFTDYAILDEDKKSNLICRVKEIFADYPGMWEIC